ncbi:MAG: hypothetical protein AB7F74_18500, partial [Parvibaculaceae bacterium]
TATVSIQSFFREKIPNESCSAMDIISTDGISLTFRPESGIIDDLAIAGEGAEELRPLHRAPWLRSGETLPDEVAPVERRLAGDFFCAPFGRTSPDLPIHGWAANGTWEKAAREHAATGAVTATYRLRETVAGAELTKHLTLCPHHPIVYQRHVFTGGAGAIPVAHHAMIHVPGRARLSFSSKASRFTPARALETDPKRGRSVLLYPQHFSSLDKVRRADGHVSDASHYPFDEGHEDLIIMSETPGAKLGWSAALAHADGFLFFALKDAAILPHTVLWMSNGGRSYAPWSSRHRAVIGIEEASLDHRLIEDPQDGQAGLALDPGRTTTVRYALGAIPAPKAWTAIGDIKLAGDKLTLTDVSGDTHVLPFLAGFF